MTVSPVLPPSLFLLQGFDLIGPNPMRGVQFGMRDRRDDLVSVPLVSQPEAAFLYCEEMLQASRSLTHPADSVLKPLQPNGWDRPLDRRLFLNAFSTVTRVTAETEISSRLIGAAQYYQFSLGRLLNLGKALSVRSVLKNRRPWELGVIMTFNTRRMQVRQKTVVGYTQEARVQDENETTVRGPFGFLRRFLRQARPDSFPEPFNDDFDLGMGLATRFVRSHADVFPEGFVLMVLDKETDADFDPLPISATYELGLGERGVLQMRDAAGRRVDPRICLLDGAHFLFSSKRHESPNRRRPALMISWNQKGFRVAYRQGPGGPGLTTLRSLFDQGYRESLAALDVFDRLPEDEKAAQLVQYDALLRRQPAFLA